jgi:hypothetical protein
VFADDEGEGTRVRWDLVSASATGVISPGGQEEAKANDGSTITMTGSGTFVPGKPAKVTGGGVWTATGSVAGNGTYQVTRLVSFTKAPGTLSGVTDAIGNLADASAGLVVLRIAYSDGSHGVLTVSCMLPVGSPKSMFEGITATKGFVDFWNTVPVNGTLFHILRQD